MTAPYGDEALVNTTTTYNQDNPAIAALADGGYVVLWDDKSTGPLNAEVRGQRFDASGNEVGGEFTANTTMPDYQSEPAVAGLSWGGFVVTWSDSANSDIHLQRFDANGDPLGIETKVNTTTAGDQYMSAVASLTNGGFVVTWTSEVADYDIRGRLYDANGDPIGDDFAVRNEDTDDSQVVALAGGGFFVVWTDYSGELGDPGIGIGAQVFDADGDMVGGPFLVNTTTPGNQQNAQIATLADGGFVVVWEGDAGVHVDMHGQRFDADGKKVGDEFLVNTDIPGRSPEVSGLANGGFVVTWANLFPGDSKDIDSYQIIAQVFDADGNKVGDEFQVNTTETGNQQFPVVAGLVEGGFAIAWQDDSQTPGDEDGEAVRAQLFNDPPVITSDGGGASATIGFIENGIGPVTTVMATDNDGVPVYSVIGGVDAGQFDIDPTTGDLTFKSAPDFEKPTDNNGDNTYQVIVQASDGGPTDTQTLTIEVSDVLGVTLIGTKKKDTLVGTLEADVLIGKKKKDMLLGEDGNDVLKGGKNKDTLLGAGGEDELNGGKHRDKLTGGADADKFVFDTKLKDQWADKIKDFEVGLDMICLDKSVFKKVGATGDLQAKYFGAGGEADNNKERILYDAETGWARYDKDGSKGGYDAVKFAKLDKNLALTADDFMVI